VASSLATAERPDISLPRSQDLVKGVTPPSRSTTPTLPETK